MTTGVTVQADSLLKALAKTEDLISAKDRDIVRYGRSIMRSETKRAFASKSDPSTGRAWPTRKGSYPWPMLNHTGTIKAALDWSYGVKTRDRKLKLFGKIRDASYLGGYNRGGGPKPAIVVAGSIFFGRSKARSERGTRLRDHRSGGWLAPTTGSVPPRPFFGFGRSARNRIKRYAEKRIAKVFD